MLDNLFTFLVYAGGVFLIYTAMKEIYRMIGLEIGQGHDQKRILAESRVRANLKGHSA